MTENSIMEMSGGAILELVDKEVSRVMDNILDPNAKADAKRKIVITLELTPSADRISVTTRGAGGKFLISVSPQGTPCGEVPFDPADSWAESAPASVTFPGGKQALYLTYVGTGPTDLLGFRLEKAAR